MKKNEILRKISDISAEEKVKYFDDCFKFALEQLAVYRKVGFHHGDLKQFTWEKQMEIIAKNKDDFWHYWNNLFK